MGDLLTKVRQGFARRVADVTLSEAFHTVEVWASRGGLSVLGIGIFGPIEWARDTGFGLVVVALLMQIASEIVRRKRDKRAAT